MRHLLWPVKVTAPSFKFFPCLRAVQERGDGNDLDRSNETSLTIGFKGFSPSIYLEIMVSQFVAIKLWQPVTVTARSKAWTVFVHLNTGIVCSNPTKGMDVLYAFILCLCWPLCRYRPCNGLITRPRSRTDCIKRSRKEKEKTAEVQQRAVDRQTDRQRDR
jgi:hypothetical protein